MMASGLRAVSWARNSSLVLMRSGWVMGRLSFRADCLTGDCNEFEAAAFGAVGLGDDEVDAEAGGDKFLERRDGEARGAAEDEI